MDLETLRRALIHELTQRAGSQGLHADQLDVSYVLNWGGFVNASFHVTDGTSRYHVKLASDAESEAKLSQWYALGEHLSRRHHAPRVVDWVSLPVSASAGLMFEHIDGATPERLTPELIDELRPILHGLHIDESLAEQLRASHGMTSCGELYRRTYHERFVEDLEFIRASPPPFVTPALLAWFGEEIQTLLHLVTAISAFDEPANAPMHGDLWLNNLLETGDSSLYVLDWDDLALGDPMLDIAMLLGPTRADVQPTPARDWFLDGPPQRASLERLAVYARASLLDWTLDPLADYIGASDAPEHADEVRSEKERVHRAAFAAYVREYSSERGSRP